MKTILKKLLSSTLGIQLACIPVVALELDTSLDDEIRRNYNPSKIEQDMALPALPKILNSEQKAPSQPPSVDRTFNKPTKITEQSNVQKINSFQSNYKAPLSANNQYIKLKAKTKIRVRSNVSISDKSRKGSKVSFISKYPVSTTYFTIPSGTTFYGKIEDVHRPQITGNGGLIVIRVESMNIDGRNYPLDAYVSKADYKNIFFNNIKGERKYLKSLFSATRPGRYFFNKMKDVSARLIGDGSSVIFAPFTFLLGTAGLGGNLLVSPAIAMFYKGGNITIPAGSDFEFRLSNDIYISN